MIPDTILVDATDLTTLAIIEDFSGILAVAAARGSNFTVPGRDGAIPTAKPRDVVGHPVPLTVTTVDPVTGLEPATEQARVAQMWANYRALVDLVKAETGETITLTRRLSLDGTDTFDESCLAEVPGGITPTLTGVTALRVVVEFINLDGRWTAAP